MRLIGLLRAATALALLGIAGGGSAWAAEPPRVVVAFLDGEINEGMPHFVKRALERAEESSASLFVLRIRTFGGMVTAATEIKDALLGAKTPTVAFIDNRAISAGALIALACNEIVMAPGSTIGAATPYQLSGGEARVSEKMISALRAIFRATAEARDHQPRLAEAMVDPDVAIPDVVEAGKLLTLTGEEAILVKLAAGRAVTVEQLLSQRDLGGAQQEIVTISLAERLADFLSSATISGLLVSLGMLALIAAFKIPGTGVAEVIAVLAFAGFLAGKHIAGLAGFEELALIGGGLVLLALEIFVIPGTGAAGIIGALALMAGIILAFIGQSPSSPFFLDELQRGIRALGLSLLAALMTAVGLYLALRNSQLWQRFSLQAAERGWGLAGLMASSSMQVDAAQDALYTLVGQPALSVTALRPEGQVEVNGARYGARASRGFVDTGRSLEVTAVEGKRLVVRQVEGAVEKEEDNDGA